MKLKSVLAYMVAAYLTATGVSAQSLTPVNIAYVPAVHFLPAFVSKEKGCFAKNGIDATLTLIPVSTNIPPALLSGSAQIGMSTASVLIPAVENGLDLKAISGATRMIIGNESLSLVIQPGAPISSAKDLVGKKIGVPGVLSVGDLVFRKWLTDNGVNSDAVTYIEVPFPRMAEMMASKTVDGVLAAEPARSALVATGRGVRAPMEFYTEVSKDSLLNFWMATGQWAASHKDIVAKFRTCLDESAAWIKANPEAAAKIEVQYLQVKSPSYPDWDSAVSPKDFDLFSDLGVEFGLVNKKPDSNWLVVK